MNLRMIALSLEGGWPAKGKANRSLLFYPARLDLVNVLLILPLMSLTLHHLNPTKWPHDG
jgi:hypothetical protein